jgi:hypothetical protein
MFILPFCLGCAENKKIKNGVITVGTIKKTHGFFIFEPVISLPDLAGREFKMFHRYVEGMHQRVNLIDAGGL